MLRASVALAITTLAAATAHGQASGISKLPAGEGCADSCPSVTGANPTSHHPIDLYRGSKLESAIDLSISVPGGILTLGREYNSDRTAHVDDWYRLSGDGWMFPLFSRLAIRERLYYWGSAKNTIEFTYSSGTSDYRAGGATTQRIVKSVRTIIDTAGTPACWPVFSLEEPGGWRKDYVRPPDVSESAPSGCSSLVNDNRMYEVLIQREDPYGNRWIYDYENLTTNDSTTARCDQIRCYDAAGTLVAKVDFTWIYATSGNGPSCILPGRLRQAQVLRPDGSGWSETDRVVYKYFDDAYPPTGSLLSWTAASPNHIGTQGDLIDVTAYQRVDARENSAPHEGDSGLGYDASVRITQYRYYGGSPEDMCPECIGSGDGGPQLVGHEDQLAVVILPEQMEYYAQRVNFRTGVRDTLRERADDLIGKTYSVTLWTESSKDYKVSDLAAKLIAYEAATNSPKRVETQWLRTAGCGCGSSTNGLGVRLDFSYVAYTPTTPYAATTVCVENTLDGTTYSPYRTHRYDMAFLGTVAVQPTVVPYVINEVVIDAANTAKQWVTHYVYDSNRRLVRKMEPSAMQSYEPLNSTLGRPKYVAHPSTGLVHGYGYDSSNRMTEIRLRQGAGQVAGSPPTDPVDLELGAALTDFMIVERKVYGSIGPTGERPYLVKESQRFRQEGITGDSSALDSEVSTNPTRVERTWFQYGFRDLGSTDPTKDDIAWIRQEVEQERRFENGPGTSESSRYRSLELFDARGDNVWSIAEDNAVTKRTFQTETGLVSSETENAEWNGSTSDYPGVSTHYDWSSGRNSAGGALTTSVLRDAQGRIVRETTPGNVHTYTRRVMREPASESARTYLSYYTEVTIPHILDAGAGSYNGPISRVAQSAGGQEFDWREFSVSSITLASSQTGGWTQPVSAYSTSAELSRRVVEHSLDGVKTREKRYHDVSGDTTYTRYDAYFAYDSLGRLRVEVNPNRTATRLSYDVRDRVVKREVGTLPTSSTIDSLVDDSTGNPVLVEEHFYDSGGSAAHGVGDGMLTYVREHPNTSSGDQRNTVHTYDFRHRRTISQNPLPPHQAFGYDNLDRPVARGEFTSTPSGVSSNTNRGFYETMSYSQRGLRFRVARAIDPGDSDPETDGYIEWHRWHDPVGRVIQEWGPNEAAIKREYDGLGREILTCTTDRAEDGIPDPATSTSTDTFSTHAYSLSAFTIGLTDDHVLEQIATRRVSGGTTGSGTNVGQVDLVTTHKRAHDATSTGSLASLATTDDVVTMYVGYKYDAADRLVQSIDFGTNWTSGDPHNDPSGQTPDPEILRYGGSAPSLSSVPSTARIWKTAYNARGLVDSETSARVLSGPVDIITKRFYDDLDRTVGVVENWKTGVVARGSSSGAGWDLAWSSGHTAGATDQDRTTITSYDGLDNITNLVAAHDDGSGTGSGVVEYQRTQYVYGVTTSAGTPPTNGVAESEIYSNDLLARVIYPDTESSVSDHSVRYGYNRLGEVIKSTDQNGVVHDLERDELGRVEVDHASTIPGGSGIDTAIRKLVFDFDTLGRRTYARSKDGSNAVVNAAQFTYNNLWQVASVVQNPTGDIGGTHSDTVSYSYTTQKRADGNTSRHSILTYPGPMATSGSDTALTMTYGATSGDVDDKTSRLTGLSWPQSGTHNAAYSYLGLDAFAVKSYTTVGLRLDRTISPTDISGSGFTSGRYPGLDSFGRVRTQTWLRSSWSRGAKPEVAHLRYTYDAEDSPINRFDRRAEDRSPRVDRDERYAHDGLHRLFQADRGLHNHSTGALAIGGARGQQWTKLTGVGAWKDFRVNTNVDTTGEPDFTDTGDTDDIRTFNLANELLTQNVDSGGSQTQDHDKAGNLVKRRLLVGGSTSTWTYVYDAWNRLVEARVQPTGESDQTRARYTYNALHWRATRIADTDQDSSLTPDQANLYYYDAEWRLLEERIDTDFASSWSSSLFSSFARTHVVQRVWGPEHIDELIAAASVQASESTFGTIVTRYAVTDRLFSVIGMVDPSIAVIAERVRYTPYGVARHEPRGDTEGDGDVDFTDLNAVLSGFSSTYTTGTGYTPDLDLDQDGDVDFVDLNAVGFRGALGEGAVSDPVTFSSGVAAPGNTVGYSGYLFDPAVGLYCVRHRWYSAPLGQWSSRDPIGYPDGMSLYQYVGSWPQWTVDAHGLMTDEWHNRPRGDDRPKGPGGPTSPSGGGSGSGGGWWHDALDAFGLIPGIGEPADALNGCIYLIEGDTLNAGLCAASMIPFAGWGSTAARQGLKHGDDLKKLHDELRALWDMLRKDKSLGPLKHEDVDALRELLKELGQPVRGKINDVTGAHPPGPHINLPTAPRGLRHLPIEPGYPPFTPPGWR